MLSTLLCVAKAYETRATKRSYLSLLKKSPTTLNRPTGCDVQSVS